jgi:hypothetical protein
MGVTIGPADWWARSAESIRPLAISCPVGTTLPDGSRIICKSGGGSAWIVAPVSTQVSQTWNGTTTLLVGDKCCICDWATLNTALLNNGFNPGDWFVPSLSQLCNPGYTCRTQWDTFDGGVSNYWSSTEVNSTNACILYFGSGGTSSVGKTNCGYVRAMRCVTY